MSMHLPQLNDMLVVVPGILGSVLRKNGRDVWNVSNSALWNWLRTRGDSLQELCLTGAEDDYEIDAVALMDGLHYIPGIGRSTGYRHLVDTLQQSFSEILVTTNQDNTSGNLLLFPYDWRLDNRKTANYLQQCINSKLAEWRNLSNNPDAKVIFICHSMGGLVTRYYLEVLAGWQECRALFTFGTPFRGSVSAADSLCNGYKAAFTDLTEVLRTLPSVYQLLPIFPSVKINNEFHRITELKELGLEANGIKYEMACDAIEFHREIENATEQNKKLDDYLQNGYELHPIIGIKQNTSQSLTFEENILTNSSELPGIDMSYAGGDGTVPKASAIPIGHHASRGMYVIERHAALANNDFSLMDVIQKIQGIQAPGLIDYRGPDVPSDGYSVELQECYETNQPVNIKVERDNETTPPTLSITDINTREEVFSQSGYSLETELPVGMYELTVIPPRFRRP